MDRFVLADLDHGIPREVGTADRLTSSWPRDVLEHVREPGRLLGRCPARALAPGGALILSVPNFGHWYPRDPDRCGAVRLRQRGMLDEGHVQLLYPAKLRARLVDSAGFETVRSTTTGLPLEMSSKRSGRQRSRNGVEEA